MAHVPRNKCQNCQQTGRSWREPWKRASFTFLRRTQPWDTLTCDFQPGAPPPPWDDKFSEASQSGSHCLAVPATDPGESSTPTSFCHAFPKLSPRERKSRSVLMRTETGVFYDSRFQPIPRATNSSAPSVLGGRW